MFQRKSFMKFTDILFGVSEGILKVKTTHRNDLILFLPGKKYMLKFVIINARKRCEIYWNLTIKTEERRQQRRRFGVFIINLEHISLALLLLTLFTGLYIDHAKSDQRPCFFWSVFSCIQSECRKIRTIKNSVFRRFSRSDSGGF